jgi:hypothetical protein
VTINNNGLRLSHWTLLTFKFKLFNISHLLEVFVIQRRKIIGMVPNRRIFSSNKSVQANRKTGFYANRDLNKQEVGFIFA